MTTPSGFQLGPWLLASKIATGGMGEVFVGLRAGGGRHQVPVAVKALRPQLLGNADAVERFVAEAGIASKMSHPNVVRILEVGLHEGRHWLAMELLHGVSLSRLLEAAKAAGTPLPAEVLAWVGRGLCDGLQHAHGQAGLDGEPLGLVHRDVTPHNVLASVHGEVKLSDFGVAAVGDAPARARPGTMHGKLEYLSPEQLEGKPVDGRTDVYAAAVTLFTLATGKEPFSRPTPQATTRAIRTEEPASLSALRPDLPQGLVAAVKKAMARKPADRFATAAAFGEALGPIAPGAQRQLGELVRRLCRAEVERLAAALAAAEELAPSTAALPVPASTPSAPGPLRPRGTMEVAPVRLKRNRPWRWVALGLSALALAALAALASAWL